MTGLDGSDIAGWALKARRFCGTGPVAEVEHEGFFLGLDEAIAGDGAIGVKKLVGDVGEDGSAARGDAAFGDEDQEASSFLG
jgi:hypothetical protein